MKILVAIDGSAFTKRMLAYIAAHDEWLGGSHAYTLATVIPAVPPRAAAVLAKDVLKAYYEDEAEKVFKPVRTFFKKQRIENTTWVSKVGHPADQLVALAEKGDFDLLLMGSHGHSTLGNLVMGSVATKVLSQTRVPVLLVR